MKRTLLAWFNRPPWLIKPAGLFLALAFTCWLGLAALHKPETTQGDSPYAGALDLDSARVTDPLTNPNNLGDAAGSELSSAVSPQEGEDVGYIGAGSSVVFQNSGETYAGSGASIVFQSAGETSVGSGVSITFQNNGETSVGSGASILFQNSSGDSTGRGVSIAFQDEPVANGPVITNVRARQLTDGSNRVEVLYDLSNAAPNGGTISIGFSNNAGGTYGISPSPASLSGDLGAGIANGSNRRILWTASQTLPSQTQANSFRARVTVSEGGPLSAISNLFTIDLRSLSRIPIASFSYNPATPGVGQAIQFTDASSGPSLAWGWDFNGDGFVDSRLQNPSHTFTTAGPHQVSLRVSNAYGSGSLTQTVNVGSSGAAPAVIALTRQYPGFFLQGTRLDNNFNARVDWQGNPGTVNFSVNGAAPIIKNGSANGAIHTFRMGEDFPPRFSPSAVSIIPKNAQGATGGSWNEPVYVFPYPTWLTLALNRDPSALQITAGSGEVKASLHLDFPDPHLAANGPIQIPSWVPYIGGAFGMTETFARIQGEVSSTGAGTLSLSGQTGFTAMGKSFSGEVSGSGNFLLSPPKGITLEGASFRLYLKGIIEKEIGIVDAIPQLSSLTSIPKIGDLIRQINEKAKLVGEISPSLDLGVSFAQNLNTGRLEFRNGTGTLGITLTGKLKVPLIEKRLTIDGWVSGDGDITLGVPEPFVREVRIGFQAGLKVKIDFLFDCTAQAKFNANCSWTPGNGIRCNSGGDASGFCSVFLSQPDYSRFGAYSVLKPASLERPLSSRIPMTVAESTIINNLFPGASPIILEVGSNKLLLWEHQDTGLPVLQSTNISWSLSDGGSWSAPALIADDTRAELSPVAGVDSSGKVVAAWLRIKDPTFSAAINSNEDLPLFYTKLEVVTSVFDPTTRTWGAVTQLTDDAAFDTGLRLASDGAGHLLLTWLSNQNGEFTSTSSSPSTLMYSFWNGSAWSAPAAVATSLVGVSSQTAAVRGANAFIVLPRDPDLAAADDGVLNLYNWNGTSWSAPSILAAGGVENRLPSIVYDANDEGHVVWLRGSDLVHATLGNNTPQVIRAASNSLSFYSAQIFNNALGNLTLVWQEIADNGPANIFAMVFDTASQTWSADRRLNEDPWEAYDMNGYYGSDGKIRLAYLATEIQRTSEKVTLDDGSSVTINNIPQDGQTDLRLLEHSLIIDLAVVDDDLSISPGFPKTGERVTASLDVHNAGDFTVGNFNINFYVGEPSAGGILVGSLPVNGPFYAGGKRTLSFSFFHPENSGNLIAIIDAANAVAEFSETNNRATVYLDNTSPEARIEASPTGGPPPLTVTLDASSSFDLDGDPLSFNWSFSDGSANATGPSVSHTFTEVGLYTITLLVTDARGAVSAAGVTINVGCSAVTIGPASLPDGVAGSAYNQTINASGGLAPYAFGVTAGELPPGLNLSPSGQISGVPVAGGSFKFTVTATYANSCTGDWDYTINVPCTSVISPASHVFGAGGGEGRINVTSPERCNWMATSNDSWITVASSNSNTGNESVTYVVRDNTSGGTRTGTITVAGHTFTVVQSGGTGPSCNYSISPTFNSFSATGGTGSISIAAGEGCAWAATSDVSWINITSAPAGLGNGAVTYSVASNPNNPARKGVIRIAGKVFSIKQKGN